MPSLLVIDDDPSIPLIVGQAIANEGVLMETAASGQEGWETFGRFRPDVVLLDVLLPDQTSTEVFDRIHRLDPKVPVIFATTQGNSHTAIEAMQLGAYEFLVKPFDLGQLRNLLRRAFEIRELARVGFAVRNPDELTGADSDLLIGRNAAMQRVYKMIGQIAGQEIPVLVTGETGTGKELVAQAVHQYSKRSSGPFVTVHCSGSSDSAWESEFFGQHPRRTGKVEQAAGGTLFLDEVGDLSLSVQGKLLRLLQDQVFERAGNSKGLPAEVRLIAATTHDLSALVSAGRFRPDLYYLLSGFACPLPPLRERLDDLPALALHFVRLFNPQFDKRICRIAPEALDRLTAYRWPGNMRELQSVLKQALVRVTGSVLLPDFLPESIASAPLRQTTGHGSEDASVTDWEAFVQERLQAGSEEIHAEASALMERQVLALVLRHTAGNQARAAKLLGITRGSLRLKMRALDIIVGRSLEVQGHDTLSHPSPGASSQFSTQ